MYEAENAFIDSLIADINHLKAKIERLEKENAELKEKLKELKEEIMYVGGWKIKKTRSKANEKNKD